MTQRSRKESKKYAQLRAIRKKQKDTGCPFCAVVPGHAEHVKEYRHHRVIINLIPYSLWDSQSVADHLLLIPKEHTAKLGGRNAEASEEFLAIIDEYEEMGYNLYARSPADAVKSVFHQHTHLIKPIGKEKNFLFYLRKPFYTRISF